MWSYSFHVVQRGSPRDLKRPYDQRPRHRYSPIFIHRRKPTLRAMSVTHTVLFQIKADADADDVKAACDRFIALKGSCLHPTSNTPYIKTIKGGKDNSPEGLQFSSAEDRDYYVSTDPSHQAFVKSIGALVEKVIVVDFVDGLY
ncbi:hypothetical protein QC762_610530 [Podospora pseudocomata]|uniref:Stress-response A/B barrel domain-containing protein n=1 Tax=Podospora pseudocomata TaxID=2093779 RepID=A0ABR0G9J1_9PEZI|nr:hypothetical protein QC762_610530 [Podospora pseudocomata]